MVGGRLASAVGFGDHPPHCFLAGGARTQHGNELATSRRVEQMLDPLLGGEREGGCWGSVMPRESSDRQAEVFWSLLATVSLVGRTSRKQGTLVCGCPFICQHKPIEALVHCTCSASSRQVLTGAKILVAPIDRATPAMEGFVSLTRP